MNRKALLQPVRDAATSLLASLTTWLSINLLGYIVFIIFIGFTIFIIIAFIVILITATLMTRSAYHGQWVSWKEREGWLSLIHI